MNHREMLNGKPVAGYRIYILDANDQLVPIGVAGEICIGSQYLRAIADQFPALRITSPVPDPFQKEGLMYRTGDYGRWLPDGNIGLTERSPAANAPAATIINTAPFAVPRNKTEQQLLEIWEAVLGKHPISIHDDFFESGGHSLKAVQLVARVRKLIGAPLKLKDVFLHSTIAKQAGLLSQADSLPVTEITRIAAQQDYPLSYAQRQFWMLSQLEESSKAYHISNALRLKGPLDMKLLQHALAFVINRHEILRTAFVINEEGEIRQQVQQRGEATCEPVFVDVSTTPDPLTAIKDIFNEEQSRPFDLAQAPLLRATVVKITTDDYALIYTLHHIIGDGWSIQVLTRDITAAYNALKEGRLPALPALNIQYRDYAAWQQQQLQGAFLAQLEDFWLPQFMDELPVLELPLDAPRPLHQHFRGNSFNRQLPPNAVTGLKALCQEAHASLFMGLLSVVTTLLYRYTGQEDIIVGTPAGGREQLALEDQIGPYLNTLPLRNRIKGEDTFYALLQKGKEILLAAYDHQDYPFNMLADRLALQRNAGRSLLFDVMIVMQNQEQIHLDSQPEQLNGLAVAQLEGLQLQTSQVDLTFTFTERNEDVYLQIGYNTDLFKQATILSLFEHFSTLLEKLVADPRQPVGRIKYLSEQEAHQQLNLFNNTAVAYPSGQTIASLFEAQVDRTPDAIALIFETRQLTYQELNEQSNRLAHHLQANWDLQPNDLVGVLLDKSDIMMIGILGILKAGAAYMPLDRGIPAERAGTLLQDAGVKGLLTVSDTIFDITGFYEGQILAMDLQLESITAPGHNPVRSTTATDLAYVMYTSGSTGKPKGVMVMQRSVIRLVANTNIVHFSDSDVLLSTGAVSFDAVTFEYWGMLLNGGCLVLAGREVLLDDKQLAHLIREAGVSIMWFTASWFNQLVEANPGLFSTLSVILVGGDRLSPRHIGRIRELYPSLTIINGYGPTENTTFSTTYVITTVNEEDIPIGVPINNSTAYILDANRQLLPLGLTGELYVGGDGIAHGYLQDAGLTEERFIPHPFKPGERLYQTGDMCRYMPDGTIRFIGRKDQQVKIRGYRVEPAEIAAAISRLPGITGAVVTVIGQEDGNKVLAAYYTAETAVVPAVVKKAASQVLPEYMIPGYFIRIDKFPLNNNGKTDIAALPLPDMEAFSSEADYIAPRNETEQKLADIWGDLLGRKHISIHGNFFELGGHSLKAIQLVSRIRKEWAADIQIKDIFNHPTISGLAALIVDAQQLTAEQIPCVPAAVNYPLSNAQLRFWVLSRFTDSSLAYNMALGLLLEGDLQCTLLKEALQQTVYRHESLRTIFRPMATGEVRQHILPADDAPLAWEYEDISAAIDQDVLLKEIYSNEQLSPFDLEQGPLLRVRLVKLSVTRYALFYTMHHIISDGWSMQVLAKEVVRTYNALLENRLSDLPTLRIQYKDYAAWRQSRLAGGLLQEQEHYWMEQLGGELPVLNLFPGQKRPALKTHRGSSIRQVMMKGRMDMLHQFCQQEEVTVFMVLLAVVKGLFYRYTGQEDVMVGVPVAGREQQELEDQIGIYLNTLPLRTRFNGAAPFRELLQKEKQVLLDAYSRQEYPFDLLVEKLKVTRDISRAALFDVLVVLQNQDDTNIYRTSEGFEGVSATPLTEMDTETSQFDLTFSFAEKADGIQLLLSYNTDIFKQEEIARLCAHYEHLLAVVVTDATVPLCQADYLDAAEQQTLLYGFNDGNTTAPVYELVLDVIARYANQQTNATAIIYKGQSTSYRMLETMACNIAGSLYNSYGLKSGDLAVILMDRSPLFVATILAIWKCGAAYVPVDNAYPAKRIQAIIEAAAPVAIITQRDYPEQAGLTADDPRLLYAADISFNGQPIGSRVVKVAAEDLAYVIFTSGSTGTPKGVMIEHAGMLNHLHAKINSLSISADDVVCQNASQSFDISVWQFFTALMKGGITVIYDNDEILDPEAFISGVQTHGITILELVPSYLSAVLDIFSRLPVIPPLPLRYLLVTGETLKAPLVAKWFQHYPQIPMVNAYGPTEAADDITHHFMTAVPAAENIPIGKPVQHMKIYILDKYQQLCPVGIAGEIYVAGIGVGRGYLNDPEKTAASFLLNPFNSANAERMYRTGDAGRYLPDGSIEFYGRMDQQVKIRGNRIELGEIESVLAQHPAIKEAAVLAKEGADGKMMLVAYAVINDVINASALLREYLAGLLPDYMIPAHIIQIDHMPLSPNGKTDRKALDALPVTSNISGTDYVPPADDMEAQITGIWEEVLGLDRISVTTSFFEMGGHSLGVIRILNAVKLQFDVKVDIRELFKNPTIRQLSEEVRVLQALQETVTPATNNYSKEITI